MLPDTTYNVATNPISEELAELNVLFAGESQTAPGHQIGPKLYDFYLLHHVLSGEGTFRWGDHEAALHAGHSFLIRPGQLVAYKSCMDNPWHYRWAAFTGPRSGELLTLTGITDDYPIMDTSVSPGPANQLSRIFNAFRSGSRFAHLEAAGRLMLMLAEFGEAQQAELEKASGTTGGVSGQAHLQQMLRYMTLHVAEPISIEEMSVSLGLSRAYMSRLFKRHTGLTPVTFLLKLRLDKARQLLRTRLELTTQQVASSVGFQDPLYFSKQFRREYGLPPSAYRERFIRKP